MDNIEIIEREYEEAVKGLNKEWFYSRDGHWYDYITSLPLKLKITYLIVVFHNQVFNGGLHQYFVNGYGQFAKETIDALIEIKAIKKAEVLSAAYKIVNVKNYNYKSFRKNLLERKIDELFVSDDLVIPLDDLDNKYYDTETEDLVELLSNYLKTSTVT